LTKPATKSTSTANGATVGAPVTGLTSLLIGDRADEWIRVVDERFHAEPLPPGIPNEQREIGRS
jgi:hypothetical protein